MCYRVSSIRIVADPNFRMTSYACVIYGQQVNLLLSYLKEEKKTFGKNTVGETDFDVNSSCESMNIKSSYN